MIISANIAKNIGYGDSIVMNEIYNISTKIVNAALAGNIEVIIDDDTDMTTSTPAISVTGTVVEPEINFAATDQTIIINGITYTLPFAVSNTDEKYYAIAGLLNDLEIPDVLFELTADKKIKIIYEPSQSDWTLSIGNGTINTMLGFMAGEYAPDASPASVDYFDVWSNASENRKLIRQISQVTEHFSAMGYSIVLQSNTTTSNTFKWRISW